MDRVWASGSLRPRRIAQSPGGDSSRPARMHPRRQNRLRATATWTVGHLDAREPRQIAHVASYGALMGMAAWHELHPAAAVPDIITSPLLSRARISALDQSTVLPVNGTQKLPFVAENAA